ncbi:MAG: SPOR domain-containing protein [Planctomycetota bacterium]
MSKFFRICANLFPIPLLLCAGCIAPGAGIADVEAYSSGEQHYLAGNFREARAFFTRYVESGPEIQGDCRARYWLGRCALALKDYDDALTLFSDAVQNTDERWVLGGALTGEGIACMFLGHYTDACRAFLAAIENAPENIRVDDVLIKLAAAYVRNGEWEKATAALNRLIAECAGSPLLDRANELRQFVGERKFVIQVGAYSNRISAGKHRDKLAANGLKAEIRSIMRAGKPLFVVFLGSYRNYREAAQAAESLIRTGKVREAVVKP